MHAQLSQWQRWRRLLSCWYTSESSFCISRPTTVLGIASCTCQVSEDKLSWQWVPITLVMSNQQKVVGVIISSLNVMACVQGAPGLYVSELGIWIFLVHAVVFCSSFCHPLGLIILLRYGEIVDVNLVQDKSTGASKGFAFIAYEDQRSTDLAVDNLNGAKVWPSLWYK